MRLSPLCSSAPHFSASRNERRPSPANVKRLLAHVTDLNTRSPGQVLETFKFVPQSPHTAIVSGTRSRKDNGTNWVWSMATRMYFPENKRLGLRTEDDGAVLYVDSLRVKPTEKRVLVQEPLIAHQIVPPPFRRFSVDDILNRYFEIRGVN